MSGRARKRKTKSKRAPPGKRAKADAAKAKRKLDAAEEAARRAVMVAREVSGLHFDVEDAARARQTRLAADDDVDDDAEMSSSSSAAGGHYGPRRAVSAPPYTQDDGPEPAGPPPPAPKKPRRQAKFRPWAVTAFFKFQAEYDQFHLKLRKLQNLCSRMTTGLETCPKTGRRHLQIAFNLAKGGRTFVWVKNQLKIAKRYACGTEFNAGPAVPEVDPRGAPTTDKDHWQRKAEEQYDEERSDEFRDCCHIEKALNADAAHAYCAKDDLIADLCKEPRQGERTDLERLAESVIEVANGKKTKRELYVDHAPEMLKYHGGVNNMLSELTPPRQKNTFLMMIEGPPGAGKSSWCKAMFDGMFDALQYSPSSRFFTGISDSYKPVAIFDDAAVSNFGSDVIKKLCNHTKFRCNVKGGYREFNYELIIVICNARPHNSLWDAAVEQRLGLLNNGERGVHIQWPDREPGTRMVRVPMELATLGFNYPAIRGSGCLSGRKSDSAAGSEFSECICPRSLRRIEYAGVCQGIYRQRHFGPGRMYDIPKPAEATKTHNSLAQYLAQQQEPEEDEGPDVHSTGSGSADEPVELESDGGVPVRPADPVATALDRMPVGMHPEQLELNDSDFDDEVIPPTPGASESDSDSDEFESNPFVESEAAV